MPDYLAFIKSMEEGALKQIAETGLLGVLLVLALVSIFFMYKETKEERNARLNDLKEYAENDKNILLEIKNTLQLVLGLINKKNE